MAALLVVAAWIDVERAEADVATRTHVAACNEEAKEAARAGTAAPNVKDERQAADARTVKPRQSELDDPTGAPARIKSEDPQLDGMSSDGAKNAVYRAAYRVCMRKSGF
jgi:hypothetical protein